MMTTTEQRKAVVAEALTWLGTPWRHEARVKGAGVDCGQLLAAVYSVVGVKWTVESYGEQWALHRGEELFLKYVEMYAHVVDTPQEGDIVLFKYGRGLSHAGIVTAWPFIIHAYRAAGEVTIDNVQTQGDLSRRFGGAWSIWLEGV